MNAINTKEGNSMCSGWFFMGGMPWLWMGGFFTLLLVVILGIGGAFWLGNRAAKK